MTWEIVTIIGVKVGGETRLEGRKRKDEAQVGTMNPARIDFVSMIIPGTGGDSGTIPRDQNTPCES